MAEKYEMSPGTSRLMDVLMRTPGSRGRITPLEEFEEMLEQSPDADLDFLINAAAGRISFYPSEFGAYGEALLRHGADINAKDRKGTTALLKLIEKRYVGRVRVEYFVSDAPFNFRSLLEHGADLSARNGEGHTPLHCLMFISGQDHEAELLEVCELFLAHGADPNAVDNDGKTPLQYAGMDSVRDLLWKYGAVLDDEMVKTYFAEEFQTKEEVDEASEGGRILVRKDSRDIMPAIRWMDAHGGNLDIRDEKGRTLLMNWCRFDNSNMRDEDLLETVKILRKYHKTINMFDRDGNTLLHLLNPRLPNNVLDYLMIECDPLPNLRNLEGKTPMEIYVERSESRLSIWTHRYEETSQAAIRRLLQRGVDINYQNKEGRTVLHIAAMKDSPDMIRLLLKEAAPDLERGDERGNTPLMYAGSVEAARVLIEAGARVDARNNMGRQPLHVLGYEYVDLLLKNGADINAQDDLGNTPLHCASMISPEEAGKQWRWSVTLIKRGADGKIRNHAGLTPREAMPPETRRVIGDELSEEADLAYWQRRSEEEDYGRPSPLSRLEERYGGDEDAMHGDPEYWDYLYGLADD